MVRATSGVCSVDISMWPVSAALSAMSIVSSSRTSPTRIASGDWRSAARSAIAKSAQSMPTSRWEMRLVPSWWMNSIGSSIVTTCARRTWLRWPIIAARVLDLPLPAAPQINTIPRSSSASLRMTEGRRSSSKVGILSGMARSARAMVPRCRYTLTRKRPTPGTE